MSIEEKQPLIGAEQKVPAHAPFATQAAVPVRSFRGPWYHIFGSCDGQDVAATCLAWKTPCIAWSWNQQRLGFSFVRELLRFVLITAGLSLGIQGLCCLMVALVCGPPPPGHHHGGDDDQHPGDSNGLRRLFHWHPHDDHDDGDEFDNDDKGHHLHDPHHDPPHLSDECAAHVAPGMVVLAAVSISLVVCFLLFLARRRTALRARFNIQGSPCEDKALYIFCGPCALAQETRTLMHENVHNGVWYGAIPTLPSPPVAEGIPMPQKMMA